MIRALVTLAVVGLAIAVIAGRHQQPTADDLATAARVRALGYACEAPVDLRLERREPLPGERVREIYRLRCASGPAYRTTVEPDGRQTLRPWRDGAA